MSERLTFNHGAAAAAWTGVTPPAEAPGVRVRPAHVPRQVRPDLAFWGTWMFTALLFFRPQDTLTFLEHLHLPEIAAVSALLALAVRRLSTGQTLVRMTPEIVGVLGFAAVMLATAPFSIWPRGALNVFLEVYLKVAVIFVLLIHAVRSLDLLRRLSWLIVVALGYVATRGVFDYVRGINVQDGRLWGPVAGLIGNPNDFAMNMVTFLPFALVVAFGREPLGRRGIAAVAAVMMLAVIVFTRSRAGMLGVMATMLVLVIQAGRVRTSLIIALVLGTLILVPTAPSSIWTRLSSIVNSDQDETGSRDARMRLMRDGWDTFVAHPLTGVGVGQFQNYNPPGRLELWHETHNVLLQVLAELGIVGGAIFLFMMGCTVVALWQAHRLLRRHGWRPPRRGSTMALPAFSARDTEQLRMHLAAATASFAGWFTCAQFASVGYYWTYYYLLALVVIARDVARARVREARRATAGTGGPS